MGKMEPWEIKLAIVLGSLFIAGLMYGVFIRQ